MNRKYLKLFLCLALVIILALVGFFVLKTTDTMQEFEQKVSANQVDVLTPHLVDPVTPRLEKKNDSETILLLGTDYREGEGARSDTMILLNINSNSKTVTGVSIPRDLVVEQLPDCEIWDSSTGVMTGETTSFLPYTMANQAYSVGGGACAVRMAEHISGLKVDRFVEVSFQGFENVINALGGVTLNICSPMVDENLGEIFTEPGLYQVDGAKALDFVRARKVYGDSSSDIARMGRQQYLLQRVKEESLSAENLLNPSASRETLLALADNMKTDNMSSTDFLKIAASVQSSENLNLFTLPSGPWEYDTNRLIDNTSTTEWIFSEIASGRTVTKEAAQQTYNTNMGLVAIDSASHTQRLKNADSSLPCGWG